MPYGTINVNKVVDTSGGVLAPISSVFRNRIINGAMVIDQRNAGASVTPASGSYVYGIDRWTTFASQSSKFSVQQNAGSVTPPTGFTNYLGITSLSAYTVGAGEEFLLTQFVEGNNIADLAWGTSNATSITLSFKVYSSLTGTFGGALMNSAQNRAYPFTYTISSANTWTTISVTIAGDTLGTWLTTTGRGIQVTFSLGVGSTYSGTAGAWNGSYKSSATGATSVVGTNGATFYITGVQLEKGSTATSFDYRPYGTELALCQRYFEQFAVGTGSPNNFVLSGVLIGANCTATIFFKATKRATPSWALLSGTSWTNTPNNSQTSTDAAVFQNTTSGYFLLGAGTGQGISFSAEL